MYYERISRRLHLEIGGADYSLAFSLNALEQLEDRAGKPIVQLVSGNVPRISLLHDAFWLGLRDGGNRKITRDEVEPLIRQFIEENESEEDGSGFMALANVFMILVALSGIMGTKFQHQVFDDVGLMDKDGKPASEAKNVETAKQTDQ